MTSSISILVALFLLALALVATLARIMRTLKRRAVESGHPSLHAYLRATPRTDQEKRDALDLLLQGLLLCALGLLFAPLLLIGLGPLYYGLRKIGLALLGLDLLGDGDAEGA